HAKARGERRVVAEVGAHGGGEDERVGLRDLERDRVRADAVAAGERRAHAIDRGLARRNTRDRRRDVAAAARDSAAGQQPPPPPPGLGRTSAGRRPSRSSSVEPICTPRASSCSGIDAYSSRERSGSKTYATRGARSNAAT